jgi:hypothetical protein
MKPFKTQSSTFNLILTQEEGGRWLIPITLEALTPNSDDQIVLESNIMTTSNISFKMTNTEKKVTPFRAYLLHGSAHEFSIDPPGGMLARYGSSTGTNIYVAFTPIEYEGKDKTARLIVETDVMYWSYDLVGRLPKYLPPQGKGQQGNVKELTVKNKK